MYVCVRVWVWCVCVGVVGVCTIVSGGMRCVVGWVCSVYVSACVCVYVLACGEFVRCGLGILSVACFDCLVCFGCLSIVVSQRFFVFCSPVVVNSRFVRLVGFVCCCGCVVCLSGARLSFDWLLGCLSHFCLVGMMVGGISWLVGLTGFWFCHKLNTALKWLNCNQIPL